MRHSTSKNVTVLNDNDPCEKCEHKAKCGEEKLSCITMFNWIKNPNKTYVKQEGDEREPSKKYYR